LGLNWTKLTEIGTELNISYETLTCDNDPDFTCGSDTGLTHDIVTYHIDDLTCKQLFKIF